jgi:hypothetical protein
VTFAAPSFDHLRRLTDAGGLYEHAQWTTPRAAHGYCVDDVARGLVVCSRPTGQDGPQHDLVDRYLEFVLAAQRGGRFVNRRGSDLRWNGQPTLEDCWGRAVWGLGAVVASEAESATRERALLCFESAARERSSWTRAMAFAALGAAQVLEVLPDHALSRALLEDAADRLGVPSSDPVWPWPEDRLSYANAALAEVLIAAGQLLDQPERLAHGLALLGWLLDLETRDGHLSLTPVGGRGRPDPPTDADQQPIEAAAMADACARAFAVTGEPRWAQGIEMSAAWFFGANDAGVSLYDPVTGGGCDGLEQHGRNENQGAESTLALISTLQQARWLVLQRA